MTNTHYITPCNRLIRITESRMSRLGKTPCLMDLIDQIAIRSGVMSKATVNLEIAALRNAFRMTTQTEHGLVWSDTIEAPGWMCDVDAGEITRFQTILLGNQENILARRQDIVDENTEVLTNTVADLDTAELQDLLAGRKVNTLRFNQKDQRYLRRDDLLAIEADLSGIDPVQTLLSLSQKEPGRAMTPEEVAGLLRIFVRAIYLTGMRPLEMWQCLLLVPKPGLDAQARNFLRGAPSFAITGGLLSPYSAPDMRSFLDGIDTPWEVSRREGLPCVFIIKSAKQKNANEEGGLGVRIQSLSGISRTDLRTLTLASGLQLLGMDERRKHNMRGALIRKLKAVARSISRFDDVEMNLYSFRHSFATRAKLAFPLEAAAALTGHTSKASLYRYGERNVTGRGRKGGDGTWMPEPDPVQVASIRRIWERDAALTPEAGMSPAA